MKSRMFLKTAFALALLQLFSNFHLSSSSATLTNQNVGSSMKATINTKSNDENVGIVPPAFELSPEQLTDFKRDGYIIIRGLLSGKELKNAIRTAKKLNRLSLLQRLFRLFGSGYRQIAFQTWRTHKSMEYVAFDSPVPSIVAQTMGYGYDSTSKEEPVRLLKDAFLVYEDGGIGCGWHVDDKYFWPCEDSPLHTPDAGVNVWITLSPLKASEGGGLAIAPTTHSISWREDARDVIAAPSATGFPSTCAMEKLSPEFHNKIESLKKTFDLEAGDAIIHDRYIFHRSDKFKKERKLGWRKRSKFRISLRYMPAKSGVFVVEQKPQDQGFIEKAMKTGDALAKGEEYFPQVWPTSLPKERNMKVKEEKSHLTWKFFFTFLKVKRKNNKKD